ncbi:Organic solute transporter subunit alpha/Transmembrane protein 184 family-containing protein [Strongyloides ratti]|uniref:Organic solute transporter subunit alpha/Transmembrane protein 184 family-containing protein n=1 Tax=Strongyloides ratti TaxID=34506 RepID=A0A090MPK9_STRRB|nr:Organic solute transporter subunit alpha/Transmembrane protein 184 family-containing protein [Strongyloides ratti]CEF60052.1 Organic solute transporter subunit alpha/Transmembrane protein 184 family-containing protein [Strongyloides ratti]
MIESLENIISRLFKLILTLINPDLVRVNCSSQGFPDLLDQPSASLFLNDIGYGYVISIVLSCIFTTIVIIIAGTQMFHIFKYVSYESRQGQLVFLTSLLPVTCLCLLTGMLSPRSATVMSSLGLLYFLLCLFMLTALIRQLAGPRNHLIEQLNKKKTHIHLNNPPFCCLFPCFLKPTLPSEKKIKILEIMVLQAPIVRGVIFFIQIVLLAELRGDANKWIKLGDIITLFSLLSAIFGIHTLARLVKEQLTEYGFIIIFRIVDISLLFFTAQQPLIFDNILMRTGIFQCSVLISPKDSAKFVCNLITIIELTIMSIISLALISPNRNALFDRYRKQELYLESTDTEETIISIDLDHTQLIDENS